MKYRITSTKSWDANRLLKLYPCLNEFELEVVGDKDENDAYINIHSIEELMKLIKSVDKSIVIHTYDNYDDNDEYESVIEIYDDWRE